MVTRALRISSSWSHYHEECQRLNNIFHRLNYPSGLISSCIKTSLDKFHSSDKRTKADISSCTHRVSIPFKTQKACKAVKQSISRLSMRCDLKITAIFRSRNIASHVHNTEVKEDLVSKSNVVYKYICSCDKSYIGYTSRYLHQRINEHAKPPSSIYLHCKQEQHTFDKSRFSILAKCRSKFECLTREALEIHFQKPELNKKDEFFSSTLYK